MTKNRLRALVLSLLILVQIFVPGLAWASNGQLTQQSNEKLVYAGRLDTKSYPKLDNKTILEIQKQARNKQKTKKGKIGTRLFSNDNPYLPGQNPTNEEKAVAYGKVYVNLKTVGLNDNGTEKAFQWKEIFGEDSNGNPTNAKIHFIQRDAKTRKELGRYTLFVNKAGEYKWIDTFGKEALLPLYSDKLEPYIYEAALDYQITDKVRLLTIELGTTDEKSTFKKDEQGRNVATIPLKLEIAQVASTRFSSEWKTSLEEVKRPDVEGLYNTKNKSEEGYDIENLITFPKNNTDIIQLRNDQLKPGEQFDLPYDQDRGTSFRNVPEVKVVQGLEFANEDDFDGTPTYNIDEENKIITSLDGSPNKYKFRYNLTYDVIEGGKLTMTEIIPITFDANGGKFGSITEDGAKQEIVKEVEYGKDLTEKAEDPTKDRQTFKGWSTTADGKNPVTDAEFTNIKEKKTFYAIWDNNDITAEELEVKESYKNGDTWINDFIPTLKTLKGQVKIKDASGQPQALASDDTFAIVDGVNEYTTDEDLKEYLYKKLQEKDNPKDEPSRVETVKAKITYANSSSQTVEIPIKVIKNIYEAKTLSEKPFYVPDDYVKVTLDPTTKAVDPQKTYYYVNPNAKVVIPGSDPTGIDGNIFTKWLIDGTDTEYKLEEKPRHQFSKETTIKAQYELQGKGIIKVKYVDGNGKEIDPKYHKDGQDYPDTKEGKLNGFALDEDFPKQGPEFKGYYFISRDSIKGKHYYDPATDTVTYTYNKILTTDDKSESSVYFPVIFDANEGEFESNPKDKKTVYVYFDGNEKTVEKVTFAEVRQAVEEAYGKPIKENEIFVEWQNKSEDGTKPADDYEIQFKGWDWDADPDNGYVPETFYAYYGQASAKIAYLDLDGKTIADKFKIEDQEYPAEKGGKAGESIAKDVFTKDNAPKFTGYKFNRIELNPKEGKYSLDKNTTIKIYYEKVPDVIPEKDGAGNPNEKPDGYVEVKFVPTDKAKDQAEKIFYVNPKKEVTIPVANPVAKATYTFKEWKMGANAEGAVYTPSTPTKFTEAKTVITATYEEGKNIIPYDPSVPDPMPRPEGYVRVTFAADSGLKLTESKAYYVKKNAGITLGNEDLVKPGYEVQTGYKFDKWDKDDETVINADILVTAKATKLDNVIPEKKEDGIPNDKPDGYKVVEFVIKDEDKTKGSIDGVSKFYVNPTEYVTINPPATKANTGYEFGAWDKDATIPTVYDKDTTITGSFNELDAVIPKTKDDDSEKPKDYVEVTFVIDPATGGKIADKEVTTYYVNPDKEVTVPQPQTQADTGYEFEKWDQDTSEEKKYTTDTTVKGNFKKLDDIIPSTDENGKPNAKPEGYVTLTFDKGDHGNLTGQKVYYVNPEADPAKTLGDKLIVKPEVKAETGYKFTSWNFADTKEITSEITVTAQYSPIDDVIPKTKDDESEKPEGYITVTFEKGANGELEGNTTFYVNPNKAVVLEKHAPTIKPNTGYTSAGWDTSIDRAIQYKDEDVITAQYNPIGDVIPGDKDRPKDYVEVVFVKGDHGELSGTTKYWVKPGVEVTVPEPSVDPAIGYKFKGWDKSRTQIFNENTKITAQYDSHENIIPGDKSQPKGYVTVKFVADDNGSLDGTTIYYVNPNVSVDLTDQANNIKKNPNVGYTAEDGTWDPTVGPKTYTENAIYTFKFKKLPDIIPGDETSQRPNGYVKVEFVTNVNGSLDGKTVYFVNPNAGITMDKIDVPEINPNPGWTVQFNQWNPVYDADTIITEDKVYAANYDKLCLAEIRYESNDEKMGTVSLAQEDITNEPVKGSTAKPKEGYDFAYWTDAKGKKVSEDAEFVPEKKAALYIAVFKPKNGVSVEVKKNWIVPDGFTAYPTMNFALYTINGEEVKPVSGAEVIKIDGINTIAKWDKLPEKDSKGNKYSYLVKESFLDQKDVKNDNWILGTMVTDENGSKSITNKLKTVPGPGETPDPDKHFVGKLTIKKILENEPEKAQMRMARAPKADNQLKFKFKVTGPYGYEEVFELAANESKTLENLAYGDYRVEEIETNGYTAEYSKEKETISKNNPNGFITVTNRNVKPTDQDKPNDNIISKTVTKVWVGGEKPATTIELWRTGKDINGKEFEQKVGEFETIANGEDKQEKVFEDLAKHDPSGREFVYYAKEADIPEGYTAQNSLDKLTITNTFKTPEVEKEFVDVIAYKKWLDVPEGVQKPQVKFQLRRKIAGGKAQDLDVIKPVEGIPNAQGLIEVNFGKQDKTDMYGKLYHYFVRELDENGNKFNNKSYQVIYSEDFLTVKNKYSKQVSEPKSVDVVAYKKWVGVPEDVQKPNVYFQLMRKAHNEEAKEVGNPVEFAGPIDENGFIKVNFGKQEKMNSENFNYSYYVVELDANGNIINNNSVYKDENTGKYYRTTYENMTVNNTYLGDEGTDEPGENPPVPIPDPNPTPDPEPNPNPTPDPEPNPTPDPEPNPEPEPQPNPEPGPGPSPKPNPGEEPGDKPVKDPDDKPGTKPGEKPEDKPGEEPEDVPDVIPGGNSNDKPGEKPGETPESPENPKPEKPKENIPEKPEKEKPPVKTENNKTNQTGTKIVKTINQTGTKIVRNVKNFLNPSTGIITNYEIYIGLMAASSVGLFFTREKKNKDEE